MESLLEQHFLTLSNIAQNLAGKKLNIYSPGVGTQGGNASEVISSGTDYMIVGRTILNAKNPKEIAKTLQLQSLGK